MIQLVRSFIIKQYNNMLHMFVSFFIAVGSLLGFHSSASQLAASTTAPSSFAETQQINTQAAAATSTIPDLFLNYDIVFDGEPSTSTAKLDIFNRLNNTYIKNKATGATTPLLSPSVYGNGGSLLSLAEIIGNTLYAAIPSNQATGIDLWKSTNNGRPTLLYKNIRIFSASGDGYVAVTDSSEQNVIILNPQGSVVKIINLSQVDFCSVPENGEGIGIANWSGHNLWLQCGYTDNSPASIYLEINADTFQITKNSQPPSELGM